MLMFMDRKQAIWGVFASSRPNPRNAVLVLCVFNNLAEKCCPIEDLVINGQQGGG